MANLSTLISLDFHILTRDPTVCISKVTELRLNVTAIYKMNIIKYIFEDIYFNQILSVMKTRRGRPC